MSRTPASRDSENQLRPSMAQWGGKDRSPPLPISRTAHGTHRCLPSAWPAVAAKQRQTGKGRTLGTKPLRDHLMPRGGPSKTTYDPG